MSLPEHLQTAVESPECPAKLSALERVAWATERRRRFEAGEIVAKQPKFAKGQNAESAEADSK